MIQFASEDTRTDEAKRLIQARRDRGFEDAKAAADFFGWNYTTYSQHERGERGLKKAVAEKYATAFRVSVGWLTTGESRQQNTFSAPVMGRIGAGAQIDVGSEQVPMGGFYDIDTIVALPADAVAFEVTGESMEPRYSAGDVIVVREKGQAIEDIDDGTEVAVELQDGMRYLKKIWRDPNGTFTLQSHNAPPIFGAKPTWVSDVLVILPSHKWKKLTNGQRKPSLRAGA